MLNFLVNTFLPVIMQKAHVTAVGYAFIQSALFGLFYQNKTNN